MSDNNKDSTEPYEGGLKPTKFGLGVALAVVLILAVQGGTSDKKVKMAKWAIVILFVVLFLATS